ncbi:hypothetical protein EDD98_4914 [Streptomyces sp. PanSC19]|uniref:hypothetical protein n=1 Tax=Streptomyces sp. PanSC19 TaxID=1520455 RepID=UPI000F4AE45D|nr:hypothetical protein [Streptomyces sp. PanSC19]ROQ35837.1 hypothetical protein EDD98_4914 [Streptomyces sp. PanSC19]
MPPEHKHMPADVAPGTVTLCATKAMQGGFKWAHLPVNEGLWADEALRDGFRARVRREVGDAAVVEVIEEAS